MDSSCYCDLLRTAARKTTAIYDRHLAEVGLTLAQYKLLKKIDRAGELSISELAAACDLDRSTIGRNAQVLEKHELVEETSCGDGRRCMLTLTETGRSRLAAAAPLWQTAQAEIEAALGPEQIKAITAISGAL
ncbi:MarR family winged helix-turn-helix transcriptional regulator [Pleomorphomonas sp. NRK KF1]|uniref:MarR family winged helix-turn-helix transcriptional regulator n=1 Tax=Pleomorphomonas sp. NRK KF1 TaxID=2943000 RepID=UPI0020440EB5|nr:MarR family winged helix-turn-helix transcriptional regulator [Pleomorphomonas sp. NRK KF1]MCM5552119.1 MarR family winged helix-turn-helix transcriptional regulator [Pleomorphomonas sp. NRK KF1]